MVVNYENKHASTIVIYKVVYDTVKKNYKPILTPFLSRTHAHNNQYLARFMQISVLYCIEVVICFVYMFMNVCDLMVYIPHKLPRKQVKVYKQDDLG